MQIDNTQGSFRIERTERRTAYENMMDALSEENSTFQVDLPIRRAGVRDMHVHSRAHAYMYACMHAIRRMAHSMRRGERDIHTHTVAWCNCWYICTLHMHVTWVSARKKRLPRGYCTRLV